MAKLVLVDIRAVAPEDFNADYLGGKGLGLAKMRADQIPVPLAFIIPTEACRAYMKDPETVMGWVKGTAVPDLKAAMIKEFGYMPLLAVRSGAPVSMPGMMDTILNVGLDDSTHNEWQERLGAKCVFDCHSRLIEMYGSVVKGIDRKEFTGKSLIERMSLVGEFPNADGQLVNSIEAVFKSWNNERAKVYRKLNGIAEDLGTAVVVQAMVFGNFNDNSGTGVAFSRCYSTGEKKVTGNWLVNGQGEDVVAGIRNADPIEKLALAHAGIADMVGSLLAKLEGDYRDMVEIEFTVQDGTFHVLQVRPGKRTSLAAVQIAVDLYAEGMLSREEAIKRVTLKNFLGAIRPVIDKDWKKANPAHAVGALDQTGKGCSVGVAFGKAVFSSAAAVNCKEPCILIAEETTPDDIAGMAAAVGILTSTGGATSHAAVVARGMDKVCVVGCTALDLMDSPAVLNCNEDLSIAIKEGDMVLLDGATAEIWVGKTPEIIGGGKVECVEKLFEMIEEHYDFYRTCVYPLEFAGAKNILLATYMMDRGTDSREAIGSAMESALLALDGRSAIVDLRPYQDLVREADANLEAVWGYPLSRIEILSEKLASLFSLKGNPAVKNLRVLAEGLSEANIEALREHGYEIVPKIDSIGSLIRAKGLCTADFDKLKGLMNPEDIARVIELKKGAGEVVRSFNIVTEVDPEHLGRSALFALSRIESVQSFLAAG